MTSSWPRSAGCTGSTPSGFTAPSRTSRPSSMRPPIITNRRPASRLESNELSLHQTQGVSPSTTMLTYRLTGTTEESVSDRDEQRPFSTTAAALTRPAPSRTRQRICGTPVRLPPEGAVLLTCGITVAAPAVATIWQQELRLLAQNPDLLT